MEALEVCHLRRITCLNEYFEARLHQLANAAHEDSLLAEEVFLSLIAERRLQCAGTQSAEALCISKSEVEALARCILMNSEDNRYAGTFRVRAANEMARAFRSDHEYINICRRNDLLVMDVEAMCEDESAARLEVRSDFRLVDVGLLLIRDQDRRDVSLLDCFSDRVDLQAVLFSDLLGLGTLIEADDDVCTAVLEVQGMSMALAAIADDGNRLAVHEFPICILIIVSFCHNTLSPHNVHRLYALRALAR